MTRSANGVTVPAMRKKIIVWSRRRIHSMYTHVGQGAEVMCMSQSLPTLFRNASGYRRQLTFTPSGVIAEETADAPNLVQAIRAHAQEVSGFVREGMPAMMQGVMGGMMGPGGMMRPQRR